MSTQPVHDVEVGDLVLVRPHMVIPTRPWNARGFTSPLFYPGKVTRIASRNETAGIVVALQHHPFGRVWEREQAFGLADIHLIDCGCGTCDETVHPSDRCRNGNRLIAGPLRRQECGHDRQSS